MTLYCPVTCRVCRPTSTQGKNKSGDLLHEQNDVFPLLGSIGFSLSKRLQILQFLYLLVFKKAMYGILEIFTSNS